MPVFTSMLFFVTDNESFPESGTVGVFPASNSPETCVCMLSARLKTTADTNKTILIFFILILLFRFYRQLFFLGDIPKKQHILYFARSPIVKTGFMLVTFRIFKSPEEDVE